MVLGKIKEEELETMFPNNGTIVLKDLPVDLKKNYLSQYSLYRKLFTEFIMKKVNLKEYDEKIANSGLDFAVNKEDDMDIYQHFSSDILRYFYIRNNIYIESLNEEEKNFLDKRMETNNYELDAEAEKFIESTYQKVIFEDALKNGNTCMVLYGPDSSSYFARNDSVVIGFRYDEFAENGLDDNAWDELHDKQVIYIYSLLKEMNANIQGILPTPMSILRYNDFSIKKRNLNEKIMENDEEER